MSTSSQRSKNLTFKILSYYKVDKNLNGISKSLDSYFSCLSGRHIHKMTIPLKVNAKLKGKLKKKA